MSCTDAVIFTSLHFTSLHFTSHPFPSLHFTSLHKIYASVPHTSWRGVHSSTSLIENERKMDTLRGPISCHIFCERLRNDSFQSQLRSFDKWVPTFRRNALPPFSGRRVKTEAVGTNLWKFTTHPIGDRSSDLTSDSPFLRFIVPCSCIHQRVCSL
jgi:hypothetical protein